jgi:hypothetical protein
MTVPVPFWNLYNNENKEGRNLGSKNLADVPRRSSLLPSSLLLLERVEIFPQAYDTWRLTRER